MMTGCLRYIVQTSTDDMSWIDHGVNVECAKQDTLKRWLIPFQVYER
jgi:hypothetical protein